MLLNRVERGGSLFGLESHSGGVTSASNLYVVKAANLYIYIVYFPPIVFVGTPIAVTVSRKSLLGTANRDSPTYPPIYVYERTVQMCVHLRTIFDLLAIHAISVRCVGRQCVLTPSVCVLV